LASERKTASAFLRRGGGREVKDGKVHSILVCLVEIPQEKTYPKGIEKAREVKHLSSARKGIKRETGSSGERPRFRQRGEGEQGLELWSIPGQDRVSWLSSDGGCEWNSARTSEAPFFA